MRAMEAGLRQTLPRHASGAVPINHQVVFDADVFVLPQLLNLHKIEVAKWRGVFVALSLDASRKSGCVNCSYDIPSGLFAREVAVNCGRSMLKRFQMGGQTLEQDVVTDRLLLTH